MDIFNPQDVYPSKEARTRVQVLVIVCAALVGLVMVVLPSGMVFSKYPAMLKGMMNPTIIDPASGVMYDGSLLFVAAKQEFASKEPTNFRIVRYRPDAKEGEPSIEDLHYLDDARSARLLATSQSLWMFSATRYMEFSNEDNIVHLIDEEDSPQSRPFLYQGKPSLLFFEESGLVIKNFDTLADIDFAAIGGIPIDLGEMQSKIVYTSDIQILDNREMGVVFAASDRELFFRDFIISMKKRSPDTFATVFSSTDNLVHFQAAFIAGELTVFVVEREGLTMRLLGFVRDGTEWRNFFTEGILAYSKVGLFAGKVPGEFTVGIQGHFSGVVSLLNFENYNNVDKVSIGDDPMKPMMNMVPMTNKVALIGAILPFVCVLIIGAVLSKSRSMTVISGSKTATLASLQRRYFALLIDYAISSGPIMGYMIWYGLNTTDVYSLSSIKEALTIYAYIGLGALWALIWLVLFSVAEGKWGVSIGKTLLKIRVCNYDLQPPGIGNALLRNLLLLLDSAFYLMGAVVAISVTDRMQRVGDMATKTIVVKQTP